MKGTRNESGTAKKREARRRRIPADSGARYRVTFVMVSAETSTSRRYTPVGTGRETLPTTINRPSTRWNESTTNLIFSRTGLGFRDGTNVHRSSFPPRDSRPIVRQKVSNKCGTMEKRNIYVPGSLYSWNNLELTFETLILRENISRCTGILRFINLIS